MKLRLLKVIKDPIEIPIKGMFGRDLPPTVIPKHDYVLQYTNDEHKEHPHWADCDVVEINEADYLNEEDSNGNG